MPRDSTRTERGVGALYDKETLIGQIPYNLTIRGTVIADRGQGDSYSPGVADTPDIKGSIDLDHVRAMGFMGKGTLLTLRLADGKRQVKLYIHEPGTKTTIVQAMSLGPIEG